MRTNEDTIRLAKIRRYIRVAIAWHKVDRGMPTFYTSENYKRAKKVKEPSTGNHPYYIKSEKAIGEIAIKIDKLKGE